MNKPATLDELAHLLASGGPFELVSGGTRQGFGRPAQAKERLDLSGFAGITLYEPEELVLSAGAATKLSAIEAALAAKGQMLAFEPPDFAPLYGLPLGQGSLAGCLMAGFAGPRRIMAGGPRDHLLGFKAASGRGEIFKAGSRVVKNVTGFDLSKLVCGSMGTLAALAEVTVKVLPAPETVRTLLLSGLADGRAVAAMLQALGLPHEVSAAAHLPARFAKRLGFEKPQTLIRLEGPEPSVAARHLGLAQELASHGRMEALESGESRLLWKKIAGLAPFAMPDARPLWRISLPPAEAAKAVDALSSRLLFEHLYDWGGGLLTLAVEGEAADAGAAILRAAVEKLGGRALLLRAPVPVRSAVPPLHPEPPALTALAERVKEAFDPRRALNPGRI
jgi:glycolate oxidase FAD binding subunit